MTYTEMFNYLEKRGFTMDFDPDDDTSGFSNVIVSWKDTKFGTLFFHTAMLYTTKDHEWVTQFSYDWTTNPKAFEEFVETFIKSCEEQKKD